MVKKESIYLFFIFLIVSFFGCTNPKIAVVPAEIKLHTNYELGKELKSSVGDAIVDIEYLVRRPAFMATMKYVPPKGEASVGFVINAGDIWFVDGYYIDDGSIAIVPEINTSRLYRRELRIRTDGTILKGWINSQSGGWTDQVLFKEIVGGYIVGNNGFRGELIYSGLTDKIIRLKYREYVHDFAKPAFYQDLTYQITEPNIIVFKTLKIQVHEASNSLIRYTVIEDGGLPWAQIK